MIPSANRRTRFAGIWYEADGNKLSNQLSTFFQTAKKELETAPFDSSFENNGPLKENILAIVSPHAGYMFSGQTAAFAFLQSKQNSRKVSRVFVLGPSHYIGFHGVALPADKSFATPLGNLDVDTEVIANLADFPLFNVLPEVHQKEHSLELQLPFIKQSFDGAKLVPLIIGSLDDDTEIRMVAQMIKRFVGKDDLVVVSSDFTHYGPRYNYEPFKNVEASKLFDKVKELDMEAFSSLREGELNPFLDFRERTHDTICGYFPCAVLLAMLPSHSQATLLNYKTSRDSLQEDGNNSVSYMAIAFSCKASKNNPWSNEIFSEAENATDDSGTNKIPGLPFAVKEALLQTARANLVSFVTQGKVALHNPDRLSINLTSSQKELLLAPRGVFVTLYSSRMDPLQAERPSGKSLRGCIGYIWPVKSLVEAVIENIIGAASRDPRFRAVSADELPDLQIDINVLTPLRRVASHKDIVVGRDGVVMYKNGHQSVFLPSVATEFGWTLEQTLNQLSLKAGLTEDAWRDGARFDVFQAESFEELFD